MTIQIEINLRISLRNKRRAANDLAGAS